MLADAPVSANPHKSRRDPKFNKRGFFHSILQRLEKITFSVADVSIATNETFKQIAVDRGGMAPEDVYIVRSIPNLERFHRVQADEMLRGGRETLVGYVGVMGAQDGVDLLVDAMDLIVHRYGRDDIHCAIVGSGTELEPLRERARGLGIAGNITFTGFLSGERLLQAFSSFDVGVIPDPKNSYNDKISMNKLFEYMSLGIPFVQFDLIEGRKTAGGAALYAADNSVEDLATKILRLADDADLRRELSEIGLARAKEQLQWPAERGRLLAAYDKVFGGVGAEVSARVPDASVKPVRPLVRQG